MHTATIRYATADVALPEGEGSLLGPRVVAAIAALRAGEVDGRELRFRAAYRDLSCKGSGSQTYRRIVLPGSTTSQWPDADRLPRLGGVTAGDRRCSVSTTAPIGTLVLDYESSVRSYRASKADLRIAIVCERSGGGDVADLAWCEHKIKRSTGELVVELPDGSTVTLPAQVRK